MSKWNHAICDECWTSKNPDREPVRLMSHPVETCCFCGTKTNSGIRVRHDPKDLECEHD